MIGIPGLSGVLAILDTSVWDAIYYSSSMVQHEVEDRYADWVRRTFLKEHDPRGMLMSSHFDMGPFVIAHEFPVEILDDNDEHDFLLKGLHENLYNDDIIDLFNCLYHVTVTSNVWFLDHMEHDRQGNLL